MYDDDHPFIVLTETNLAAFPVTTIEGKGYVIFMRNQTLVVDKETECAETEPEQSCRATGPVCGHNRTWDWKQTAFTYDCKQFVLRFFLRFCTRLILGLKPKNQTTQHDDSSQSRHVTLYHTYPQRSNQQAAR